MWNFDRVRRQLLQILPMEDVNLLIRFAKMHINILMDTAALRDWTVEETDPAFMVICGMILRMAKARGKEQPVEASPELLERILAAVSGPDPDPEAEERRMLEEEAKARAYLESLGLVPPAPRETEH